MMRWVAVLAAAAVAVAIIAAVVRAPRLSCTSLESDRCITAASAILDQARSGPRIVAIGLVGYRGCPPLPIYCPLSPQETYEPLAALAGVQYDDAQRRAFYVGGVDPGLRPSVSRMGNLEDYVIRLVFPTR